MPGKDVFFVSCQECVMVAQRCRPVRRNETVMMGAVISFRQTAIGEIGISCDGEVLIGICFGRQRPGPDVAEGASSLLDAAFDQLGAWLSGSRRHFDLPLAPPSTPFAGRVRAALLAVPYGATISYARLAGAAGSPGGARAVGNACAANPFPVVIPCHRVLASDGGIGGYRGGTALKHLLLDLERRNR